MVPFSCLNFLCFDWVKIWKMGRKYEQETKEENGVSTTSFSRFLDSYSQLLWFSYRKDFPAIENSLYLAQLLLP
jgi:hypothetical protein